LLYRNAHPIRKEPEKTMTERIQALGKHAYAIPFGIALIVFCVLGTAIAPMMRMAPNEMPVAIVNLDEGALLPTGDTLIAGDRVVDGLRTAAAAAGGETGKAPMAWTELSSRAELDMGLDNGEYYGAIVIPADFTKSQLTAQTTETKPKVELVVNTVKSPIFANTMQTSIGTALASQGVEVEVTSIGNLPGGANPLSGILGVQMMVMPLFIMSLAMSVLIVLIGRVGADATHVEKGKAAGVKVGLAAVASLVAATLSYGVVAWLGGVGTPSTAIWFLWLASFCMMLACIGLCSLALPLGLLAMVAVFALGMGTAVLPAEMLPAFWADWVMPWAPQVAIGDGLRNIILLDGGAFDVGVPRLLAWGAVGLVALLVASALPIRSRTATLSRDEAAE
jgi:hypothetical protein